MSNKVIFGGKLTWVGKETSLGFWDEHWLQSNKHFFLKKRLPWYVRKALRKLPSCASIIEAGCGTGFIVRALANKGYSAFGVDYAEQTIKVLRNNFPELNFSCQDVRNLHFTDSKFDAYLSLGVIEHFVDEKDALSVIEEAIRVTKPEGIIFISVPFTNRMREKKIKQGIHETVSGVPKSFYQRAYTIVQFKQLVSELPLKLEEIIYYDLIGGLSREIRFFYLSRDILIAKILIGLFNRYTSLFNNYTHMVGFKFINRKSYR